MAVQGPVAELLTFRTKPNPLHAPATSSSRAKEAEVSTRAHSWHCGGCNPLPLKDTPAALPVLQGLSPGYAFAAHQ